MAILAIWARPNLVNNLNKRNGVWRRSISPIQGLAVRAALVPGLEGVVVFTPPKTGYIKKWKNFGRRFRKENDWWKRKNLKKIFPCENPSWKYHLHWSRVPFKICVWCHMYGIWKIFPCAPSAYGYINSQKILYKTCTGHILALTPCCQQTGKFDKIISLIKVLLDQKETYLVHVRTSPLMSFLNFSFCRKLLWVLLRKISIGLFLKWKTTHLFTTKICMMTKNWSDHLSNIILLTLWNSNHHTSSHLAILHPKTENISLQK